MDKIQRGTWMMQGIDSTTGKDVDGIAHLRQSVRDILTTRIGSRVMRRSYGSNVPRLVDNPMNEVWTLNIIAEAARALKKWEPRIKVKRVIVTKIQDSGRSEVEIEAILVANGKPIRLEGIVL